MVPRPFNKERFLSTNCSQMTGWTHAKECSWTPTLYHIQILTQTTNLSVSAKIIKHLEKTYE